MTAQTKVAIILPVFYKGGTLRAAKKLAKLIKKQSVLHHHPIEVVLCFVPDKYEVLEDFHDLIDWNIQLREIFWDVMSTSQIYASDSLTLFLKHNGIKLDSPKYLVPRDGFNDLLDVDLWIIISDRLSAPVIPLRKVVLFIFDYIQRYVPDIFSRDVVAFTSKNFEYILSARRASHVFVTTQATKQDAISFAGLPTSKVTLIGDLNFDYVPETILINGFDEERSSWRFSPITQPFFMWPTNVNFHKNISRALDALIYYYTEQRGKFTTIITGANTEYLDPYKVKANDQIDLLKIPHIDKFRKVLSNKYYRKRIKVLGDVPDSNFFQLILSCKFVWNPTLYDNGTYSVIEAALLGKPSLSALYPATEYWNNKLNLNLVFFNPYDKKQMASSLKWMEENCASVVINQSIRQEIIEQQNKAEFEIYQKIISFLPNYSCS